MLLTKPFTIFATCLTCVAPTLALSQDAGSGFYITGAIGGSLPSEFDGVLSTATMEGDFVPSAAFRFGAGYQITPQFRAEADVGLRSLAYDDEADVTLVGTVALGITGSTDVTTLMISGLYDLGEVVPNYSFYAGLGLGVARVDVDVRQGPDNPDFRLISGDYTALATQLRLGAARELSNGAIVFVDYTYLNIPDTEFDGLNTGLGDVEQSFGPIQSQDIAIGVRFAL